MRRPRAIAALAAAAAAVAAAGYAVADPHGYVVLDDARLPVAALAVGWLLVALAVRLARPSRRAVLVGTVVAVPAVGASLMLALTPTAWGDSRVVQRVPSPDGRADLIVVAGFAMIDPVWEVRLRDRRGLLSRERCVFRSVEWPPVTDARFAGVDHAEVRTADGATHTVPLDVGAC